MCKSGSEDYFPFTLSYLADTGFFPHASEEPSANAAATFEERALDRFLWHFQKGLFYKPEVPFIICNALLFIVYLRDHCAVVFRRRTAESIHCPTSVCRHSLELRYTDGRRRREREASFSGQLCAQAERPCWWPACHCQAQGSRTGAFHVTRSPLSRTV